MFNLLSILPVFIIVNRSEIYAHPGKDGIGSSKKNLFFLNQYNDFNISQHTKGQKCPKYFLLAGS